MFSEARIWGFVTHVAHTEISSCFVWSDMEYTQVWKFVAYSTELCFTASGASDRAGTLAGNDRLLGGAAACTLKLGSLGREVKSWLQWFQISSMGEIRVLGGKDLQVFGRWSARVRGLQRIPCFTVHGSWSCGLCLGSFRWMDVSRTSDTTANFPSTPHRKP